MIRWRLRSRDRATVVNALDTPGVPGSGSHSKRERNRKADTNDLWHDDRPLSHDVFGKLRVWIRPQRGRRIGGNRYDAL